MLSFQTAVTLLIVAGAAFILVRRIYRSLRRNDSTACGCGCSGCNATTPDRQNPQNRSIQ
jgi:hypothetical protein